MPRQSSDYYDDGSGMRFLWRLSRMQRLHKVGWQFDLTHDSAAYRTEIEEEHREAPGSDDWCSRCEWDFGMRSMEWLVLSLRKNGHARSYYSNDA
jgi:hypothetical protein